MNDEGSNLKIKSETLKKNVYCKKNTDVREIKQKKIRKNYKTTWRII